MEEMTDEMKMPKIMIDSHHPFKNAGYVPGCTQPTASGVKTPSHVASI